MIFGKTIFHHFGMLLFLCVSTSSYAEKNSESKCPISTKVISNTDKKLDQLKEEIVPANLYTKSDIENMPPYEIHGGQPKNLLDLSEPFPLVMQKSSAEKLPSYDIDITAFDSHDSFKSVTVKFDSKGPSTFRIARAEQNTLHMPKLEKLPQGQILVQEGRPYIFVKPNGEQIKIYLGDQKIIAIPDKVNPVQHLMLYNKTHGFPEIEIRPLLKEGEDGLKEVQGGIRKIYEDKISGEIYKFNLNTDPQFSLDLRTSEQLVTRYFNKAFENSASELGLEISAVPHNYTYGEIGWSSQRKIKGQRIYDYRKSLSSEDLEKFNKKLLKLKNKLKIENLAVAESLSRELPGSGHIFKGIDKEALTYLSEWKRNEFTSYLTNHISAAIKKGDMNFVSEIMSKSKMMPLSLEEMSKLTKNIKKLNELPKPVTDAADLFFNLAFEKKALLTFNREGQINPHIKRIEEIMKSLADIEKHFGHDSEFKLAQQLKMDNYLTIAGKAPTHKIEEQIFNWCAEQGLLADIDTGLIHTHTPLGHPSDLNNCLITGVKKVNGETIEVIECFDIH